MPQALPFAKAVGAFIFGKSAVASVARYALAQIALTALSKKLSPTPEVPSQEASGTMYTVNSTVEPRRIIYGQTLVSGLRVYASVTGTENEYLWNVIALAAHEVEDITDVWLDSTVIADGEIGDAPGVQPSTFTNVTGGSHDYNDFVGIQRMLGTTTQAYSSWLGAQDANWTSSHQGKGVAYIVTCYKYFTPEAEDDPNPWQSVPSNIRAVVKGKKVYDPRLDSTNGGSGSHRYDQPATWAWSENPALCLRDYLIDTSLGLSIDNTAIDDVLISAAANTCEETVSLPSAGSEDRYTFNGTLHTGMTPAQIIMSILTAMQGTIIFREGKFRVYAGEYNAPTVTLTSDDLAGEIKVRAISPTKDRFNACQATYTSVGDKYQTMEASLVTNSTYEAEDGGTRLTKYISLPHCNSETMAQRIGIQLVEFSRMQKVVEFPAKPSAYQLACHDTVTLDIPEMGWSTEAENLINYSEDLTNAAWGKVRVTVAANQTTAPDGTLTACSIDEDGTAANDHYVYIDNFNPLDANTIYTFSASLKAAKRNWARFQFNMQSTGSVQVFIDLNNGSIGTIIDSALSLIDKRITPEGNGWYRCEITFNTGSGAGVDQAYIVIAEADGDITFDGLSQPSIYAWGAAVTKGSGTKPYWPTNGTAFAGATKVFRVTGTDLAQSGAVSLTLREENSAVYTDPDTGDYGTPGVAASLTFGAQSPPAPTDVAAVAYTNHVVISWTPPLPQLYTHVEVYTSTTNDASTAAKIGQGAQDTLIYYPASTATHYYWTKSVNVKNLKSSWSPGQTNGVAAAITTSGDQTVLPGVDALALAGLIPIATTSAGFTVNLGSNKTENDVDTSSPYDSRAGFRLNYNSNSNGFMETGNSPAGGGAITSWTDDGDICTTTGYTSSDFEYQWVEVSSTGSPTKSSPVAASTWQDFNATKTWYAQKTVGGSAQWVIDVTVREKATPANTDTVRITMNCEGLI